MTYILAVCHPVTKEVIDNIVFDTDQERTDYMYSEGMVYGNTEVYYIDDEHVIYDMCISTAFIVDVVFAEY